MSWMLGVRIVEAAEPACATYREPAGTTLRIEVRNPPVLTAIAIAVGTIYLVGLLVAVVLTDGPIAPSIAARLAAAVIAGLLVVTTALNALRPHTRIVVERDVVVVARSKHGADARVPLRAIDALERQPATGGLVATTGGTVVLLANGLLPEQVVLIGDAIERAPAAVR